MVGRVVSGGGWGGWSEKVVGGGGWGLGKVTGRGGLRRQVGQVVGEGVVEGVGLQWKRREKLISSKKTN